MKANDVFISYSTRNSEIAVKIRQFLQSHGINCWMAPESIPAGSNYTKEIPYGILYSKVAVLILSNASINSIWVNQEVTYLLSANKIIIPFIIENINENPSISYEPFSNVSDIDTKIKFEGNESFRLLLHTIQKQLGRVTSFTMPNCSDDYLQLGLKDLVEDGGMLMDNGRAEVFFRKSADLGNSTAMRYLAMLITSEGDAKDAIIWWEKAAAQGDVPALVHEAKRILYSEGDINSSNIIKAKDLLEKAVISQDPEACTLYAELILNPLNNERSQNDIAKALQLLELSFSKGYWHAGTVLGDTYRKGVYVKECPEKAFGFYKKSSKSNTEQEATLKMADCYSEGYGVDKDLKKAYKGYADFCFFSDEYIEKYADCLNYGWGVKSNKKKALDFYQYITIDENDNLTDIQKRVLKKRFELGDSECAFLLGYESYKNSMYDEAYRYFELAAKEESPKGFLGLGVCFLYGYGTEYDLNKAFLLFSKSYSKKCKDAAKYLALCYQHGIGTAKSESRQKYFEEVEKQEEEGIWNLSFFE